MKMKIKEYAILNANIEKATGSEVIFESQNKDEIVRYLEDTERDKDDEYTTIEVYYVDEDGDFVEGSDYDTPSNFIKNIERR
jgi:ketosteroid isomerase-like protein